MSAPGVAEGLAEDDLELLRGYCTSVDSHVFCLKNLPEEVIAVLFAYYSRSEGSLRENLVRLLRSEELLASAPVAGEDAGALAESRRKAREFHERWVVGYGHASVAEHAVAHVAVENVSILASKVIEDSRLASYTEKSTRYVPFPRRYTMDATLPPAASRAMSDAIERLFEVYETLLPAVTRRVEALLDRSRFKTERGFMFSCRAQACDAVRYVLPAATHTNLGLTANARTLETMITRLLSHPLEECRTVGERIREQASLVIPTLIKYARPNDYRGETPPAMARLAAELLPESSVAAPSPPTVRLIPPPLSTDELEVLLAAGMLYEGSGTSYEVILRRVRELPADGRRDVIAEYLRRRRRYGSDEHGYTDPPLRALEHLQLTFEIVVDYGAYRDIQRHRMATQLSQRLDCSLGYETPELLAEGPDARTFTRAMEAAAEAHALLAVENPEVAQYVIPLAYRKRVLFTWNLRSLHHFISLRSARQGHPSYRRVAQEVYRELHRWNPFLAEFIRVDLADYDLTRPD